MSCNIVKYRTVRKFPIVPRLAAGGVIRKNLPEGFRRTSCLKFTEGCCGLKLTEVKDIFCRTQAIENTSSCDEGCCPLDMARGEQFVP